MSEMEKRGTAILNMFSEVRAQAQLNIANEGQGHGKWEKVRQVMDSGSTVPVWPPTVGKEYTIDESEGSRKGVTYMCANKDVLANLGEKTVPLLTREGTMKTTTSQVADVSQPLQSVRHVHKSGHMVIFDGADSFMLNKHTGEINLIEDDGHNYILETWIIPPDEIDRVAMLTEQYAAEDEWHDAMPFQRQHP